MSSLDAYSELTLNETLAVLYKDDAKFCRALFPDAFSRPFSQLHREVFEGIKGKSGQKIVLAPRGIGKTTILRYAKAAKSILFRDKKFIVYIGGSLALAEQQTENLKYSLLHNKNVRSIFGNITIADTNAKIDGVDDDFSKLSWVAFGNTLVLPRGYNQQIRGLNWRDRRPDLILLDDPEDKDELMNEELRAKRKSRFLSDIRFCVDWYNPESYEIVYIDTLKHQDALPLTLKEMNWSFKSLAICDENLKSLAPEFISDDEVKALYDEYEQQGALDDFYRELLNNPIAPSTAAFRKDLFRYMDDFSDAYLNRLFNVILIDVATTDNPKSDWSAIIGVAVDPEGERIFVRDIEAGHLMPDDIYNRAIDMAVRLKAQMIAVEKTGPNNFLIQPFQEAILSSGHYIELFPIKATVKKEKRIKGLIPLYRKGYVYHNRHKCEHLEQQLMSFPYSKRKDVMDAFANIIKVFEETKMFLQPEGMSITDSIMRGMDEDSPIFDVYDNKQPLPVHSMEII